jgi:hypothetical protein
VQEKPKEIRIDFPKELIGGAYSNNMAVTHTREEFIMDFWVFREKVEIGC